MPTEEGKIYIILLTGAMVFALILVLFIVSLLRNFKRFKALQKEKLIAEITATEKERRKIASDIHDDIAPVLAAAKMQISSADSPEPALQKAMAHIDDVITQVRTISHTLMPVALLRKGLVPALRDHIDSLNAAGTVRIDASMENVSLNDNDVHVYRIVHEIMHNSIKHANASHIQLHIHENAGKLNIDISDNGKGMQQQSAGMGLMNIGSRIELLAGTMQRSSESDKGVAYHITIPVNHEEPAHHIS